MPLHGLVQKARLDAEQLPYRMREHRCFWLIEKYVCLRWRFVCRCETDTEAEDFLMSKLSQIHP